MQKTKPAVGIIANPLSGRDVRRLVTKASVFQNAEKSNMVLRILGVLGKLGIDEVFMLPDVSGVASRVIHAMRHGRAAETSTLPHVTFLEMPITDSAVDSLKATELMKERGVSVIIVMGGDGTHRVVASASGDTPLLTLSTGTNNVFPEIREATITGLAAGLLASGKVRISDVGSRNKVLRCEVNGVRKDLALVDLAVSTECWIGARALWEASCLRELYVSFAEPDAIGLSSIAALIHPVPRSDAYGLRLIVAPPGKGFMTVQAPIAPGIVVPVSVAEICEIRPKEVFRVETPRGTIALDGEREIEFSENDSIKVWLEMDGPVTVNVSKVMQQAAKSKALVHQHEG
jgi:predicted polyphosphate/ATP-dependent NAD kinase